MAAILVERCTATVPELDVIMAKNMGIQSNDFDILSVNLHWHATLFIVLT